MIIFYVVASAVIIVLAGVAVYYHILLHRKNQKRQSDARALELEMKDRQKRHIESIRLLARAVIDDQVTLTEASIRINTLSQALPIHDEARQGFEVFRQLSEATAHIPILNRWKALSKKEKIAFDKEREVIEEKFREFAVVAATKIVSEGVKLNNDTDQA